MQLICKWFYSYGVSRVQTRISLVKKCLFTYYNYRASGRQNAGTIYPDIISVAYSQKIERLTNVDSSIYHYDWRAVQIKSDQIF